MRKLWGALVLTVLIGGVASMKATLFSSAHIQALPVENSYFVGSTTLESNEKSLLVKLAPKAQAAEVFQAQSVSYTTIPMLTEKLGIYRVPVDASADPAATLAGLSAREDVEFAEFPVPIHGVQDKIPNDTYFNKQWHLQNAINPSFTADTLKAWSITEGSGVTVAVLDSGVNGLHEDLSGQILAGMDFIGYTRGEPAKSTISPRVLPSQANSDDNGHGTAISGVIAANNNNGLGVSGIAPLVKILPVKILDFEQNGDSERASAGIVWAADQPGVKVFNLSLGATQESKTLKLAINYAVSKDILVVAASGNENKPFILYPAAQEEVVAVGAMTQEGNRASEQDWGTGQGSHYGPQLSLIAPGHLLFTTKWEDGNLASGYDLFSGTSAAAPVVSAIAALVRSADATLGYKHVKKRLEMAALPLKGQQGHNNEYGYGLVQANSAITFDKTAPQAAITPLQEGDTASYPYFAISAQDDISTKPSSAFVADETSSTIQSVGITIDKLPEVVVTPIDKGKGATTLYYQSTTALADGDHTIHVVASDSSGNKGTSASRTFHVSTAVPTYAIANLTPKAGENVRTVSIRVIQTKTFQQQGGTTNVEVPLANVEVSEKKSSQKKNTNALGIAVFSLSDGAYTFSATYDGKVVEKSISVPETLQGQLTFIVEEAPKSEPVSSIPTATPIKKSTTSAPSSGMDAGLLMVGTPLATIGILLLGRRKRGKKSMVSSQK